MKKNFRRHKFFPNSLLAVLILVSPLTKADDSDAIRVPRDWYEMPENSTSHERFSLTPQRLFTFAIFDNSDDADVPVVKQLLETNAFAMDSVATPLPQSKPTNRPKDWVPWHMEFFTTDISITAGGLIGLLAIKGTPSVQVYWRRKEVKKVQETPQVAAEQSVPYAIQLDAQTSQSQMQARLEPVVQTVLRSQKVKSETLLRKNILKSAEQFQSLANSLQSNTASEWWASGLRLDFQVGADGAVSWGTVGGDLRFRFDWKRLKRQSASPKIFANTSTALSVPFGNQLQKLANFVEEDLERGFDQESPVALGLKASSFRVGLGISVKGDLGFAKGSAAVVGHVYFSRDLKKSAPRTLAELPPEDQSYAIVQHQPQPLHLDFAMANGLPFRKWFGKDNHEEAVYNIARDKVVKGLRRAAKLAGFFAKRGQNASSRKWQVYQVKTGFDLSLSGNFQIVTLGATPTAEVTFNNMNF